MKKTLHLVGVSILSFVLAGIILGATFTKFSPATGILKGTTTTFVTTAATSADVIALWTGTCNSGSFLSGAGACTAISAATTGTFTASLVGCSSAETQNFSYTLIASAVILQIGSTPGCTSNAVGFTAPAATLPAAIRPAVITQVIIPTVFDNSVVKQGCLRLQVDGSLTYFPDGLCNSSSWVASGNKQIAGATGVSYRLN